MSRKKHQRKLRNTAQAAEVPTQANGIGTETEMGSEAETRSVNRPSESVGEAAPPSGGLACPTKAAEAAGEASGERAKTNLSADEKKDRPTDKAGVRKPELSPGTTAKLGSDPPSDFPQEKEIAGAGSGVAALRSGPGSGSPGASPFFSGELSSREAAEARRIRWKQAFSRLPSRALALWKEYRRNAKAHVKEGAVGLALGLCAYMLGSCRLLFGTSPLGLALLCASPKKTLWIFLGLCASALSLPDNTFIYLFAYATAVSVRILARLLVDVPETKDGSAPTANGQKRSHSTGKEIRARAGSIFTESIYLRMATGCASAFMIGLFTLVSKDFVYYDLFGAIFSMLCTPIAVFVYAGCFESEKADPRFREGAIAALMISVTYAIRNIYWIGISAGLFFAFFLTLYVCRKDGLLKGILLGLLCGLAYAPPYAPLFAVAALAVGTLHSFSDTGSLIAAGAAAMLWGFYIDGVSAMSHLLPAIVLSEVCFVGARRLSFFPAAKDLLFSGRYCSDMNNALAAGESREEAYRKMAELSDTFSSLSEVFYNLSDRLCRPGLPELRRMCDSVYDRYCPVCPNRNLCWELEYASSKELLGTLSEALHTKGLASAENVPDYMRERCLALPGIIGEINHGCAELSRLALLSDKSGVFAMDYSAVSSLLADAEAINRKDFRFDPALTEKVEDALTDFGFGHGGVSVYGNRRKRIVARGFDLSGNKYGSAELKRAVERACGFPVSEPVIELKENVLTLRMAFARLCRADCTVRVENTGEEECGDSVASFESSEDKFYALISDGMGRGREAAFTSGVCSIFLQKMLGTGNRAESVIKMLNSFIRSGPSECSTTVDLLELDLLTGHAEFIKCGASPSYVRRKNNLFKLAVQTLPLGILRGSDAGRLSFDTEPGDVIIMLSDGVTPGSEECIWLLDLLSTEWDNDLDRMTDKIIQRAREAGSRDDISVILARIEPLTRLRGKRPDRDSAFSAPSPEKEGEKEKDKDKDKGEDSEESESRGAPASSPRSA